MRRPVPGCPRCAADWLLATAGGGPLPVYAGETEALQRGDELAAAGELAHNHPAEAAEAARWHAYCSRCGDCLVCQGAAECTRGGDHELELSWAVADRADAEGGGNDV